MRAEPFVLVCLAALSLGACMSSSKRVSPSDPVAVKPTSSRSGTRPAPSADTGLEALSEERASEIRQLYADGLMAHRAGQFDVALGDWERVWDLAPGYADVEELLMKEYLVRGLESFSKGGLDEAIQSWEKAQKIRPDDARVRAYLERAHEQRERKTPPE